MSGKVKDSLHELIHALSKSEKRYYKVFAGRHVSSEDSTMILLFDFIARQAVYDEDLLFAHFRGKPLLNQFSTVKRRLYEHILQAMDAFHSSSSPEAQVSRMLHQAQLLYNKALYDQCIRHLRSTEKLAEKHELHLSLVQINKLRQQIGSTRGQSEFSASATNQSAQLLQTELLILRLQELKTQLLQLVQQMGTATTPTQHEQLDSLLSRLPEERTVLSHASAEAEYLFHHIQAAYHFAKGRPQTSLAYTDTTIAHLLKHPGLFGQSTLLLSALTNGCYLTASLGDPQKAGRYLAHLKGLEKRLLPDASEPIRVKFFTTCSSIELSLHILEGTFREALPAARRAASQLELLEEQINPTRCAFLRLKLAVIAFGNEHYGEALKEINAILNDNRLDPREELVATARLINIAVHFELGHPDHVAYTTKQARKLLNKGSLCYDQEQHFLSAMLRLPGLHPLDHGEAFYNLLNRLNEAGEKGNFNPHFDFVSWIETKVHGRTFAEAVKERYGFRSARVVEGRGILPTSE